ncbi:DNA sulfur modification protein DndB [Mycobacteroides abscessus subsp. abscessus]|nr:DNA sulfur modification protein DndB [Mycobacteroides abscessus]MDB2184838.1 DNA sulfur modification protein DndB [Mycobacteroides abscessus subsp. abscessus]
MTQTHTDAQSPTSPVRARTGEFEWAFPAIRGVQAGREYYVTMCPLRLIPRMFLFDEEELTAEMRAQRTLNKGSRAYARDTGTFA